MNEVNLPEVRLVRVAGDARAVPDLLAGVGIALYPESGDEPDRGTAGLAERVLAAETDAGDGAERGAVGGRGRAVGRWGDGAGRAIRHEGQSRVLRLMRKFREV